MKQTPKFPEIDSTKFPFVNAVYRGSNAGIANAENYLRTVVPDLTPTNQNAMIVATEQIAQLLAEAARIARDGTGSYREANSLLAEISAQITAPLFFQETTGVDVMAKLAQQVPDASPAKLKAA